MRPAARWMFRLPVAAAGLVAAAVLAASSSADAGGDCGLTLKDFERMSLCQLQEHFANGRVDALPNGKLRGRLVYLTDRGARWKIPAANSVWRGKAISADGPFVNRWIGGVEWIASEFTVGPSWVDGKPAILMEYPAGTPLFWNMHDELREVAPGLFIGPVYERFPCPKFRGYIALQLDDCCEKRGLFRR